MAYLSIEELRARVNAKTIHRLDDEELDLALEDASSEADTYLRSVYAATPLEEIPGALKMHVARAALYHLMSGKVGFSPDGDDSLIRENYQNALAFYKAVQKNQQVLPEPPTTPARGPAVVVSNPVKRGW